MVRPTFYAAENLAVINRLKHIPAAAASTGVIAVFCHLRELASRVTRDKRVSMTASAAHTLARLAGALSGGDGVLSPHEAALAIVGLPCVMSMDASWNRESKNYGPGIASEAKFDRRAAYIRPRCHRGFISWRRRRLSNHARGHWIDGGIMNDPLDAGRNKQHSGLRFGCDIVDVIGSGLAHDLDLALADIERLRAF
jgi:hypothetical protein